MIIYNLPFLEVLVYVYVHGYEYVDAHVYACDVHTCEYVCRQSLGYGSLYGTGLFFWVINCMKVKHLPALGCCLPSCCSDVYIVFWYLWCLSPGLDFLIFDRRKAFMDFVD